MSSSGETLWLQLVSGSGSAASLARAFLRPVSWAYGAVALAYRGLYEAGLRRAATPCLPLLSVGALSVGGAGKTTVTAYFARRALTRGLVPAIILRGYRRHSSENVTTVSDGTTLLVGPREGGDEAVLLAQLCPGAVVVVGKRREEAIGRAAAAGARVALLDDGFQYFRLRRNVDLVVLNALQWGPAMTVFPAGILREPPRMLARASQVWITHVAAVPPEIVAAIRAWAKAYAPSAPQVLCDYRVTACRLMAGGEVSLAGATVAAFCGIGSPESFRRSLSSLGPRSLALRIFPDHHPYTPQEVADLAEWAAKTGAEVVVTTAKDAVRLGVEAWPEHAPPLAVLEVELQTVEGETFVEEAMEDWLAQTSRPPS